MNSPAQNTTPSAATSLLDRARQLLDRFRPYSDGNDSVFPPSPLLGDGEDWIRDLETAIDSLPSKDILPLFEHYDLLHRLVYRQPPSSDFIHRQVMTTFRAMINADPPIDPNSITQAIDRGLSRNDRRYLGPLAEWHALTISRWYRESLPEGTFTHDTPADAIRKARLLLAADLSPYTPDPLTYRTLLLHNYPL